MEFTKFALTDKFDRAFALAASLHRDQKRKNIPAPFMVHLMSVAALVAENIGFFYDDAEHCEEFVMTAILHDTIEDQGGKATYELLRAAFSQQIADNVIALSDCIPEGGKKPPKSERNASYLQQLATEEIGIVIVSCCDKIHNLRSMHADSLYYAQNGNIAGFWKAFSQNWELTLANYKNLREVYANRLGNHRLIALYDDALEKVVNIPKP